MIVYPANLGMGLRALLMVQLPGLAMTKQASPVFDSINYLGLITQDVYEQNAHGLSDLLSDCFRSERTRYYQLFTFYG